MKITRKQLRKLIAEAFIGAPDGTVYTPKTKKAHSEEGEAFGGGSADEMDIPVVYGEDHTKEATPKLYGILTRNWHEIHSFHKKGPYIYKILMNPDTDPDNKKYFLSLLWQSEIITAKALEDASLEIDLLTSSDFKDFRDQSAERLEKKHQREIFGDIKKQRELYKNPEYVKWAKKQIDKVVDGGFEYFKDAIQEIFYHDMYDYKYKGHAQIEARGYNPDEGVSATDFVDENLFLIGGLLGAYRGFNKTEDAAYYNTELDDYTNDKSHDLALVAIDALVGAGILEKTADSKVRMPIKTYQIMLNNEQGRKEDFYNQSGTRSAFLDDPYVSNPNLPVVTEAMIRQMIREALDEGSRIIVDPEGKATVASDDYRTGTAKDAQTTHPELMTLRQSGLEGQRQARQLAVDLDMQPELTTAEEVAVEMGEWKAKAPDLQFHNELPGTKSIEFSQYLKRECEKRGLACTVEDARHKKPNKPYIVVSIEGGHPLRYEDINAVVYINDTWMKELEIDIRAYYPDAPAGVKKERRGVLTPRNTRPYTSGTYGENGLEQLAELVVDALSEL